MSLSPLINYLHLYANSANFFCSFTLEIIIWVVQRFLQKKSEAIATYALCSFANPSSVASVIAMVSALCPEKMEATTKLAFRAYVGGIVTCLISASLAGNSPQ